MPIYEYRCEGCGHKFQVVSTIAEHRRGGTQCPRCRKGLVALQFPDFHANEGTSSPQGISRGKITHAALS